MDFEMVEKAINETRADIEKYLNEDEFKMMAAYNALRLVKASQNAKGQVIYISVDEGLQIERNCNEALREVIIMNMLEEYGIEEFIKYEAARRIINPNIQKVGKHFDAPEEMEVFKKMHNMSAEDIEKLKNEK
jgi:hypothetical protein